MSRKSEVNVDLHRFQIHIRRGRHLIVRVLARHWEWISDIPTNLIYLFIPFVLLAMFHSRTINYHPGMILMHGRSGWMITERPSKTVLFKDIIFSRNKIQKILKVQSLPQGMPASNLQMLDLWSSMAEQHDLPVSCWIKTTRIETPITATVCINRVKGSPNVKRERKALRPRLHASVQSVFVCGQTETN